MPFSHQTARLSPGRHVTPEDGVCVMELASVLAGEPFTDRPSSASPLLTDLLQGYNDGLDDARRQTLLPFAATVLGTAGGGGDERRRRELLRAFVAELRPGATPWARLRRRLAVAAPYTFTHQVARRVAATGDDDLHARVCALLHAAIAHALTDRGAGTPDARVPAPLSAPTPGARLKS